MKTITLDETTTFSCEVDSHHGIYCGQIFAEMYKEQLTSIVGVENVNILQEGPDHKDYVETWAELFTCNEVVFDGLTFFEFDGDICSLSTEEYNAIDWESVGF